jgi:ubiquinone/menaquinone biosynthesis C-methylase UbiE
VLHKETTIATLLEETDYDAIGQVSDRLVRIVGDDWKNIIATLGVATDHVLEIGSGTGVLTRGLLQTGCVGHVTATDVSEKFLRRLARQTDTYDTPVSLVASDANEANFRSGAFDLVLGRSILHHLLHYDETLRQCNMMLKPGGAAVFFEPILQGKIFLTLLLAQVLRCDELSGDPKLSPRDVGRVRRLLGHHLKAKIYPQDYESLARLEDKYVFDIDDLREVGTAVGFSRVDYINNGTVDPSFWPLLSWTLRGIDVDPRRITRYRWVGEEFANTYGLMFGDRIATPMAYFVFHK